MFSTGALSSPTSSPVASTPITLEPVIVERIWGTHHLAPWHDDPPAHQAIGEIWLTAEDCKAVDGFGAGQTLAALTAAFPDALGDPRQQGFPLLIKLLFPNEKLSVQVHPNDDEAQALGMPRGKTECWYVLSAEPGAQVAVGLQEPLSREQLKAAIADGTLESRLRMIPVKAGDMVFVDAGTVHAIGPGMVVLETQQYSDTTYRLWDYGRPRELHIEAGTAVTRSETAAGLVSPVPGSGYTRLVQSRYFAVDRFTPEDSPASLGSPDRLQILIALADGCQLTRKGDDETDTSMPLARGRAVVLPVSTNAYTLRGAKGAEVIRILQP